MSSFSNVLSFFQEMLYQDRQSRETSRYLAMADQFGGSDPSGVIHIKVRRDYIYEDAFNDLSLANGMTMRVYCVLP